MGYSDSQLWNTVLYVRDRAHAAVYGEQEKPGPAKFNLEELQQQLGDAVAVREEHVTLMNELERLRGYMEGKHKVQGTLEKMAEQLSQEKQAPGQIDLEALNEAFNHSLTVFEHSHDPEKLNDEDRQAYNLAVGDMKAFAAKLLETIATRQYQGGAVAPTEKEVSEEVRVKDLEGMFKMMDKLDDFCTGGPVVSFVRGCIDAVKAAAKAVYNAGPDLGIESGKFKEGISSSVQGLKERFSKSDGPEEDVDDTPKV